MAQRYHWPGNVRELENVVKRCVIDAKDCVLTSNHFLLPNKLTVTPVKIEYLSLPLQKAKIMLMKEFESVYLQYQLHRHNGNVEECARRSGKHRSALWALLKKHKIDPKLYRQ